MSREGDNTNVAKADIEPEEASKLPETQQQILDQDDRKVSSVNPVATRDESVGASAEAIVVSVEGTTLDMASKTLFLDRINENVRESYLSEDNLSLEGSVEDGGNMNKSGQVDAKVDSASSSERQSISSSDVTLHDKPDSGSDKDSQRSGDLVKERNGLEIRNNVRDVKEVKKVDNVLLSEAAKEGNHVTKIHRQSPGLAHRLAKDPDSSGSERELDTSEIDTSVKSGQQNADGSKQSQRTPSTGIRATERKLKKSIVDNLNDLSPTKEPVTLDHLQGVGDTFVNFENVLNKFVPAEEGQDVENEYDYVKYARIQDGDSYVGMRLAFNTADESGVMDHVPEDPDTLDHQFVTSSLENSPDKLVRNNHKPQPLRMSNVNEETLTEIPLNGNDHLGINEPNNFSLSPELTECDSAEVESVISDEEKATTSGMPNVEDGLSSSAGSDVEDNAVNVSTNATNKCPSDLLKRKYKNDIDLELQQKLNENEVKEFFSPAVVTKNEENIVDDSTPEPQETIRRKKEALDLAIKDIKTAIERSKFSTGGNEKRSVGSSEIQASVLTDQQSEDEAIWVMREAYNTKAHHGEDLGQFEKSDHGQPADFHSRDTEQAYPMRVGNADVKRTTDTRPEGKPIQPPKGYDSDDDRHDTSAAYGNGRGNMRGKGYSSLPHEDAVEAAYFRNQIGSSHKVYGPAMFFGNKKKQQTNAGNPNSNREPMNELANQTSVRLANKNTLGHENNGPKKPEHGNFSNTLPISRYRSDEARMPHPGVQVDNPYLSDKDRMLQSYGYGVGSSSNMGGTAQMAGIVGTADTRHGNYVATSSQSASDGSPLQYGQQHQPGGLQHFSQLPPGHSSHLGHSPTGMLPQDQSILTQYADRSPNQYLQQQHHSPSQSSPYEDGTSHRSRHVAGPAPDQSSNHATANHLEGTAAHVTKQPGQAGIDNSGMQQQHQPHPRESEGEDCHGEDEEEYYAGEPAVYIQKPKTDGDYDTDEETDELLDKQYHKDQKVDIPELSSPPTDQGKASRVREGEQESLTLRDPDNDTVLIEGVLFRAKYLGSTTLISEGQPSKSLRMMQAQEAVGRIKAPEGENQPSTDVDLFISTEKIMVLNTNLQEIMMDHSLRTISYIADIGDIIVIMARRGPVSPVEGTQRKHQSKICCHVFESDEAQLIAQSIGQAFQVAYMEFLKANGIEDPSMMKEMDYQEVLNQQEIFGEELFLFSNKETQKEIIVPKLKNEALGIVVVESGWGSMVPTVVLANMSPTGPSARCGQLNIGDQIMSINGVSLVGLPLSSCINYIKASRTQTVVKLTVVSCAPVVEVLVKRPDVKYQLGFSVQNGVICSLLRGGIAERGGVRVGHRIIEINGQSVVAVAHEKIVSMLASAVGEINMKTMPTSIFRLLTGQEVPHYI